MDELGDHKQPVIIPAQQLTNTMRRRQKPQSDGMVVKPVLCGLRTLDVNKTLGVALIELSTNVTKYNFIECYLAFKTSFVLGDNRFCRQVKHIMGTPMSIKPHKMNYSQDVEPLPLNIIKKLMVRGNREIPVHIHHNRITLPLHLSKKDKKDVVIECRNIPDYFQWTLKRLDLSRPSLPSPQTNSD
ncbi:unnamed protein product [Oppiella nova]|uniref:Uncharacterized protein n=1 Tax=Oppiella nova TaxID=334625 RepID=A0A7R9MHB1_9ACAR|nr:unnamed protein product [Oppiella nova]CAG2177348.1 unnamed protein product [Oppiella nova]